MYYIYREREIYTYTEREGELPQLRFILIGFVMTVWCMWTLMLQKTRSGDVRFSDESFEGKYERGVVHGEAGGTGPRSLHLEGEFNNY